MKPFLKKLVIGQILLFMLAGLVYFAIQRQSAKKGDEGGLDERAVLLAELAGKREFAKIVKEFVFAPERVQFGVLLVRVRKRMFEEGLLHEGEQGLVERLFQRARDVVMRELPPDQKWIVHTIQVFRQLGDPGITDDDLETRTGEAKAGEFAAQWLELYLEERFAPLDPPLIRFDETRDLERETGKDGKETQYFKAVVRFSDGAPENEKAGDESRGSTGRTVELRMHQRRRQVRETPRWYIDLAGWSQGS